MSSKPEVLLRVFDGFLIYYGGFSSEVVFCLVYFFTPVEAVEHSQHFLFVSRPFCKAEEIERNSLSEVETKDKSFLQASDSSSTAY